MAYFELDETQTGSDGARIKVIGIGGAGCNAINNMISSGLEGVEFIAANTDMQALDANLSDLKLQIGSNLTKGLGAGSNPEVGRKAALEDISRLGEVLAGSDMVFVTAGMGGGTGTGASPIVAQVSREIGALTVGVVTKPFDFEGRKRHRNAEDGLLTLAQEVDTIISVPNQKLLDVTDKDLTMDEAFSMADEVLLNAVRGISDIINMSGGINVDFADVRTVMTHHGQAIMGDGTASGEDRAIVAAEAAINHPLLDEISINGAMAVLVNITSGSDLKLQEVHEAVNLIEESTDEDSLIIFGWVKNEDYADQVKVTVIATGFPIGGCSQRLVDPATARRSTPRQSGAYLPMERPSAISTAPQTQQRRTTEPPVTTTGSVGIRASAAESVNEDELDIPAYIRTPAKDSQQRR